MDCIRVSSAQSDSNLTDMPASLSMCRSVDEDEGVHDVCVKAFDKAGNSDVGCVEAKIDETAPTIEFVTPSGSALHVAPNTTSVKIRVRVTDALSGVNGSSVTITASSGSVGAVSHDETTDTYYCEWSWSSLPSTLTFTAEADDNAGNHASLTTGQVTVTRMSNCVQYVRPGFSGNGDSWETAYGSVQLAINDAALPYPKCEVWVAAGTYTGTVGRITAMKNGVAVYGGFTGIETAREERNWSKNVTILDGNQEGSVVKADGIGSSARIDGFTIRNGSGTEKDYTGDGYYRTYYGGGIYCWGSSPAIEHNTITGNNIPPHTNYDPTSGGGIACLSGSNPIVANNIISQNISEYGGGIACWGASPTIVNNTIVHNSGIAAVGGSGGIDCWGASATISNNIIAFNSSGISNDTSTLDICSNDVFNTPGYDYCKWVSLQPNYYYGKFPDGVGTANIFTDPLLTADGIHIQPNSPCKDTGANSTQLLDIDGEARIQNGTIDRGADEVSACWHYALTLTSTLAAPMNTQVTLTAHVLDTVDNQPEPNYRVDISVDAGEIVSVTRNGTVITLPSNTQSTYGITDEDGNVDVVVTRQDEGYVHINSTIVECGGLTNNVAASIFFYDPALCHVGFLYNLCYDGRPNGEVIPVYDVIDQYLTRINNYYSDVVYYRIDDIQSGVNSAYNTVFVVLPIRDLNTSELNVLNAFVQSGRNKRVVLVGEHNFNSNLSDCNGRLNSVATALGMSTQFRTADTYGGRYDISPNLNRRCSVNSTHYLMAGVTNLWDSDTDTFQSGWEAYARPLAYVYTGCLNCPWILEEDTTNAGSRIAIHDSSLMYGGYNDQYDTVPDKNFRFIYNLCAIFPQ